MTGQECQRLAVLRDQLRALNARLHRVAEALPPGSQPYSGIIVAIATTAAAAQSAERIIKESQQ